VNCSAGWTIRILAATTMILAGAVCADDAQPKGETPCVQGALGSFSYRCYGGLRPGEGAWTAVPRSYATNETKKKNLGGRSGEGIDQERAQSGRLKRTSTGVGTRISSSRGRKFTAFLSLIKRNRQAFEDNLIGWPWTRTTTNLRLARTSTSADAAQVKELNALTVQYSSMGQPVEIEYTLSVTAGAVRGHPCTRRSRADCFLRS